MTAELVSAAQWRRRAELAAAKVAAVNAAVEAEAQQVSAARGSIHHAQLHHHHSGSASFGGATVSPSSVVMGAGDRSARPRGLNATIGVPTSAASVSAAAAAAAAAVGDLDWSGLRPSMAAPDGGLFGNGDRADDGSRGVGEDEDAFDYFFNRVSTGAASAVTGANKKSSSLRGVGSSNSRRKSGSLFDEVDGSSGSGGVQGLQSKVGSLMIP